VGAPVRSESGGGHLSGAKGRKKFFGRAPPHFGSKSTISRFGERFRDGNFHPFLSILFSLVSLLFGVLLLTVPPCPMESAPYCRNPSKETYLLSHYRRNSLRRIRTAWLINLGCKPGSIRLFISYVFMLLLHLYYKYILSLIAMFVDNFAPYWLSLCHFVVYLFISFCCPHRPSAKKTQWKQPRMQKDGK